MNMNTTETKNRRIGLEDKDPDLEVLMHTSFEKQYNVISNTKCNRVARAYKL